MSAFEQQHRLKLARITDSPAAAAEGEAVPHTDSQTSIQMGQEAQHAKRAQQAAKQSEAVHKLEAPTSSTAVYRTRWLAWSVIAAGWLSSLTAIVQRGGAVEWFLAALLSGIILFSGLAPLAAASGLSAVRVLSRKETNDGGQINVQLTLRGRYRIPLVWVAVHEEALNVTAAAAKGITYRTVMPSWLHKEAVICYSLRHLRRGEHEWRPISVTVGDWLGLTAIHKEIAGQSELVVLPGLTGLDGLEYDERGGGTASVRPVLELAGSVADARGEAGREEIAAAVRAAGIGPENRPYREGDSLRHLDWRNAARGRGLHTKIHTPQQPYPTFIAIDSSAASYGEDERLLDACSGWAALAVKHAAVLGGSVTLLTCEGVTGMKAEGHGSEYESVHGLLRALAVLRADSRGSLAGSLMKQGTVLAKGGTILVFTADWRAGRNWGELAGYAAEQGCRLELFAVTRNGVPTFAMQEQQKWLEAGGVKVTWLHVPADINGHPFAEEGGAADGRT